MPSSSASPHEESSSEDELPEQEDSSEEASIAGSKAPTLGLKGASTDSSGSAGAESFREAAHPGCFGSKAADAFGTPSLSLVPLLAVCAAAAAAFDEDAGALLARSMPPTELLNSLLEPLLLLLESKQLLLPLRAASMPCFGVGEFARLAESPSPTTPRCVRLVDATKPDDRDKMSHMVNICEPAEPSGLKPSTSIVPAQQRTE